MRNILKLPSIEERNIQIFYINNVLHNAWFFIGNWIFFWTLYMSYTQLGWVDAIGFGFGLLMEIPTGAVADFFGKRKTIILATLLSAIGILTFTFGRAYTPMLIGFLIAQLGWALYSGSGEALAYDTLLEKKKEETFEDVISTAHSLRLVTIVVCSVVGIWVYSIANYLPQFIWGIAYLITFAISFFIIEPKVDSYVFSWRGYFKQFKSGFKTLLRRDLLVYTLPLLMLMVVYTIYDIGLVRPAVSLVNNLNDVGQSIVFALASLSAAALVYFLPKLRKYITDYSLSTILILVSSITFLMLGFRLGPVMAIPMILLGTTGGASSPLLSIIINKHTKSEERATTLSTAAFVSTLPYALSASFIGWAIDSDNFLYFVFPVVLISLFVWGISFVLHRSK
ncbi:MFS transporter [Candidatus Dojkabacteria bacterium]|uniref:MFS transporter n=1 Tax=Candidatus Dojkabacteria bacterium TaxID=2099670 RepID=A0A955RJ81_9BACT|nr:MFS transporter [Candidatus Dojkabacteria bacterium]